MDDDGRRLSPDRSAPKLVADRSCDGCTLCCKLMAIAALDKPALTWCRHCDVGVGCGIYRDRPQVCMTFYCAYRISADLGEEWRPSVCKMVVSFDQTHNRINVAVDPSRLSVWREAPYFQQIKKWATDILRKRGHLVVWEGLAAIVVLPDREAHLGEVGDHIIVVMGRTTPSGEEYDALALPKDDPRLVQYKPTH